LKTAEEPNPNTVFILCTTDPQKIPNTILSRVQRYDFKKISYKGIYDRLIYIINQENNEGANIQYTPDAIDYISRLSDGGMRDSITTLDKCISYSSNLTLDNVIKALGGVNYDTMFDLAESIYNFDATTTIKITETIYSSGANIKQFIKDFSNFVLDLCKYGLLNSFEYLYIPSYYSNRISTYTGEHYAFFNQLLGELTKLNNTIKWEGNPKPVIESTFILLCQKA
jgi:DNA polymerase-3 subunit gamma/tau